MLIVLEWDYWGTPPITYESGIRISNDILLGDIYWKTARDAHIY